MSKFFQAIAKSRLTGAIVTYLVHLAAVAAAGWALKAGYHISVPVIQTSLITFIAHLGGVAAVHTARHSVPGGKARATEGDQAAEALAHVVAAKTALDTLDQAFADIKRIVDNDEPATPAPPVPAA